MVEVARLGRELPVDALGRNSLGWLGMVCLITTEASLFAYLLFSYAFMAVRFGPGWLPSRHPSLTLSGPDTLILLSSSVAVWWGERGVKRGNNRQLLAGLGITIGLGLVFLVVQAVEWKGKSFGIRSSSYGSLYYTITGFHMAHVVVGVIVLSVVFTWSVGGYFNPRRHSPVMIGSIYWHFVDVVWLFVFTAFYITPYLMGPS